MAILNSDVYKNGVDNTFLDENKIYAIFLLADDGSTILATSAAIKKIAAEGYIGGVISWSDENKQLSVSSLSFKQTKSVLVGTSSTATQYSIAEINNVTSETSEAYTGSGDLYYWPDLQDTITHLVIGNLSSPVTVEENNNFRFDNITVKFSEADTI